MALFHCYGETRCVRGSFVADSAEPDDTLHFPISIGKAVGPGAPNECEDVKTIQKALNRFPDSMGGPQPKLTPNGNLDRLTMGAIEKFQRRQIGFTDQKIEPDRWMINRINELVLTIWMTVPDRTMKKVYEMILPEARRCVQAANAALQSARPVFDPLGALGALGTIAQAVPALTMINRHFLLDQNPKAARDFEMISELFRKILTLLHLNVDGWERTFVPAPGRFSADSMATSHVLAMCRSNGANMKGGRKAKAQDGSDVTLPNDKVMIMVPFTFASRDLQIMTVIHELAHFVGHPEGSPNEIDDPPSGSSEPSEIANLPPQKRPRLAECYATFAFEARFGREPIRFLA
jgi:hypothetical protein